MYSCRNMSIIHFNDSIRTLCTASVQDFFALLFYWKLFALSVFAVQCLYTASKLPLSPDETYYEIKILSCIFMSRFSLQFSIRMQCFTVSHNITLSFVFTITTCSNAYHSTNFSSENPQNGK